MGEQRKHEATFVDGQLVEGETTTQRWARYLAQGGAILAGVYVIVQATLVGAYLYGARAKADALEQYLVKQAQQVQAGQQATPAPAPAKTK